MLFSRMQKIYDNQKLSFRETMTLKKLLKSWESKEWIDFNDLLQEFPEMEFEILEQLCMKTLGLDAWPSFWSIVVPE